MGYKIFFTKRSKRQFSKLTFIVKGRISKKIDQMIVNPYAETKKLKVPMKGFRVRVGNYRILYEIKNKKIIIYSIQNRKDIY